MKRSFKKIVVSGLVVAAVLGTTLSPTFLSADETVVHIDRQQAQTQAVNNSATIIDLEYQRHELVVQHDQLKDSINGLNQLHGMLSTYKSLEASYQAASAIPNLITYLGLRSSSDSNDQAMADRMTDNVNTNEVGGEPAASMSDTVGGSDEEVLSNVLSGTPPMTVESYVTYLTVKAQFASAGIMTPYISKEMEYSMFVENGEMALARLDAGITSLNTGIKSAQISIHDGAGQLYDSVLMLEGYLLLQKSSYEIALTEFENAKKRYEQGTLSEKDYIMTRNKEEIARRNMTSMERQLDDITMSLNVMLGNDVTTSLVLKEKTPETFEVGNIEGYIEQGLSQRNEIDKIETDIQVKEAEIEKLRQYFGRSSDRYKDATNELELLQIDREKTISDVELNIRDAYMNYELKAADRLIKEADLDDVKRQYKEAELSVELGYSVASTLDNLNALVEQKTKAYDAANRDYEVAISALNNASSFGPAYTSSTAAPGM